jgi:hypothetical protein
MHADGHEEPRVKAIPEREQPMNAPVENPTATTVTTKNGPGSLVQTFGEKILFEQKARDGGSL